MSQPSSSIISGDNAEVKYKKALKEISKLIAANRTLRQINDRGDRDLKEKIDQLSLRYEDLEKQYEAVRKQKQSFNHYLDQIQKQRNNLEREVAYLNDVLAEQNAELKKLNMHKDERAVAALIRTYEEKEATLNRNRTQNQDMIGKLKAAVERLENDLQFQRAGKQQAQDRYRRLTLEIGQYKQQNSSLLTHIERLLKQSSEKDQYCIEKQRELKSLVMQLQKQINLVRSVQDEPLRANKANENEAYEQLLSEKNKLIIELTKTQAAYQEVMTREKDLYQMEERMKTARLQAQRANEEVNMLKSKIVVLQAKQFLEEAGDDDQKFFEERLNILIAQNDPLNSIKNNEDNSHFRILKSFIVDLQDKIYKMNAQKKQVTHKYKSMKIKFVKNAQQLTHLEQQNKLMRGKLQGYERLTEKLQFELQRSLATNEQELARITITSNNLITKKVEEYKGTINLLNSQLEMSQDKASRTEKNNKQQIQTLRLELDTLKIRYKDESDKANKDNELVEFFKKKNNDLSNKINSLEEQLSSSNQNLHKFEQLFKEEKGKNEGLLAQKQQLQAQTRQLSEQIDKKASNFSSSFKIKEDQYEFEVRKLRAQNQKLKDELEYNTKQVKNLQKDLQQIRRGDQSQVGEIKRLTNKNVQLESKLAENKRRIREIEDDNETLKIKNKKLQQSYDKTTKYDEQNIGKTSKINDLSRQKILLEGELKNIKNQLSDQLKQNEDLKKELSNLKMKNLDTSHESKKQFESKLLEVKRLNQSLAQQLSDVTSQLREEKSKLARIVNQLNIVKAEKTRLQQLIDQNRKKDLQNQTQVGNIKIELANAQMEIQKLNTEIRSFHSSSNNLNTEIETLQQKIFAQNQELSSFKMKLQAEEDLKNDLIKDLNSIKFNFSAVESHSNQARSNLSLPWQEQTFHTNLNDILSKIKRISRNYNVKIESSAATATVPSYQPVAPIPSFQAAVPINNTASSVQVNYIPTKTADVKPRGDSYLDYFKSYSDPHENQSYLTSAIRSGEDGTHNFDNYVGSTQSIGKVDYNYSASSYDNQSGGNAGINYEISQPNKSSNYDFNFSSYKFSTE